MRLGLYRVAEEAIANALKHSEASKVVVRLGVGADTETLQLSIEDNGRGFDPETTPRGLGLTTMDDYLAAIGGTYTLETAPGQGTRATATIQLNHRSDNGSRASLAID